MPQRFSAVLAEKAPVEHPRLVLRFETEARIEFLAEPLVRSCRRRGPVRTPAKDELYNEAANQVAMHAESVLGLRQAIVGR